MVALGHVVPQFHHLVAGSTPFLQILTMAAATWQLVNESDGAWLHSFPEGALFSVCNWCLIGFWKTINSQLSMAHGLIPLLMQVIGLDFVLACISGLKVFEILLSCFGICHCAMHSVHQLLCTELVEIMLQMHGLCASLLLRCPHMASLLPSKKPCGPLQWAQEPSDVENPPFLKGIPQSEPSTKPHQSLYENAYAQKYTYFQGKTRKSLTIRNSLEIVTTYMQIRIFLKSRF